MPRLTPLSISYKYFGREKANQWLGWLEDQIEGWDLVRGSTQRHWDSQFSKGGHVEDLGH